MSFKLNPFTANFDLTEDNVAPQGNSVWVDAKKGNDNTGLLDRMDKPFATISAAVAVVKTASIATSRTFNIYIANGTYNIDRTTDDTLVTLDENRDYIFRCASRTGVVINNNGTGNYLMYQPIAGVTSYDPRIEIHGGTWNHNTTSIMIWANKDQANFYFYNCNLNNNTGTGVFYKQSVSYAYGVTAISAVGDIMQGVGNGGNQVGGQRFSNCYLEAVSGDIDGAVYGSTYDNCTLISQTGVYNVNNGQGGGTFRDCIMQSFNRWIFQRGSFNISFLGECRLTITNPGFMDAIRYNGASQGTGPTAVAYTSINIDTLVIAQEPTNTSDTIRSLDGVAVPLIIKNKLIAVNPPQAYANGAIGIRLLSATVGNIVTFDLPGGYRGIAPIAYTIATTVVVDEVAAMKAAIDAQVLTPGTPWNIYCNGDVNNVRIQGGGLDFLRVYVDVAAPMGFRMRGSGANGYVFITDVAGDIQKSNVTNEGTYSIGPGEVVLMKNQELWYGQGSTEIQRMTTINSNRGIYS